MRDRRIIIVLALALAMLVAMGGFTGCTAPPPVQEMSDARQALQAARQVNAEEHAPENLVQAQVLLDGAVRALESGRYGVARQVAVQAKQEAMKARYRALVSVGN